MRAKPPPPSTKGRHDLNSSGFQLGRKEAHDLVATYLKSLGRDPHSGDTYEIRGDLTEEHGDAWIFYWGFRRWVRTRNPRYAGAGTDPILVDKLTGLLHLCVGPYPPRHSLTKWRNDKRSLPRLCGSGCQ